MKEASRKEPAWPLSPAGVLSVMLLAVCASLIVGCTESDPLYCESSETCPSGQVCSLEIHTCVPAADGGGSGPLGSPCSGDQSCDSKHCVEGICCESSCGEACRSCKTEGKLGRCALVPAGPDPRGLCGAGACAGSCDGEGSCVYPGAQQSCQSAECSDGKLTTHSCDGEGGCTAATADCGGYACADGASCKTSCSGSADCTGTFQCEGQACVNELPAGSECGTNDLACASKHCVDGVCCSESSCSACHACNTAAKKGSCAPVEDGTACGAATCKAGSKTTQVCKAGACTTKSQGCAPYLCNAAGTDCAAACSGDAQCAATAYCEGTACLNKKANGVGCTKAKECSSNQCTAEKVCCDSACAGDCETCVGKPQCSAKPKGAACGTKVPFCVDQPTSSVIKEYTCDGNRSCIANVKATCDPYRCVTEATGASCTKSCSINAACTTGVCDLDGTPNTCRPSSEVCFAAPSTCNGQGTQSSPYCKIQQCLDQSPARPYVAIADGTYAENLNVKSSVQLIATGDCASLWGSSGVVPKARISPPNSGGGVWIQGNHKVVLHGLAIYPASSAVTGPLLRAADGADVTARTSWFESGNQAPCISAQSSSLQLDDVFVGGCSEGGISSEAVPLTMRRTDLTGNGVWALRHESADLSMRDVHIHNGINAVLTFHSALDWDRVRIGHNTGKALSLNNSTTGRIANLLVHNNGAGLVLTSNASPPKLINVTLVNNTGAEITCDATTTIVNSIVWGGTRPLYTGPCEFSYCDVASGAAGVGNISADPQFVATGPDPYDLKTTSPCIDKGYDNFPPKFLPLEDLIGRERLVDYVPGGAAIDMGAYEFQ